MKDDSIARALRSIPSVDELLGSERIRDLRERHPRFPWTAFIRRCVDEMREIIKQHPEQTPADPGGAILDLAFELFEDLRKPGMRRVINGTGVILHTNLGRALLGEEVRRAVDEALRSYVSLEFDLERAERSGRGERMEELVRLATGAEDAMVVNNNAAAVYLAVNTYCPPGRVLVSRGELVEIGGSFRLPDILSKAAGEVLEVGTTNRTYLADYENRVAAGDLIIKVHQSNYRIQGFTHEASLEALATLARTKGCYLLYDLGSGALFDFEGAGFEGEEMVENVVGKGIDCITMSGDKLLGGMQAGILVGKRSFLSRLRKNPLARAVRVDKSVIAAVEALMRIYLFSADPRAAVPTLWQVLTPKEELERRARAVEKELQERVKGVYRFRIAEDGAAVGGGSFATREVESIAVVVECPDETGALDTARRMRTNMIALIPRIRGNELRFNLRSVPPWEDQELIENLVRVLTG